MPFNSFMNTQIFNYSPVNVLSSAYIKASDSIKSSLELNPMLQPNKILENLNTVDYSKITTFAKSIVDIRPDSPNVSSLNSQILSRFTKKKDIIDMVGFITEETNLAITKIGGFLTSLDSYFEISNSSLVTLVPTSSGSNEISSKVCFDSDSYSSFEDDLAGLVNHQLKDDNSPQRKSTSKPTVMNKLDDLQNDLLSYLEDLQDVEPYSYIENWRYQTVQESNDDDKQSEFGKSDYQESALNGDYQEPVSIVVEPRVEDLIVLHEDAPQLVAANMYGTKDLQQQPLTSYKIRPEWLDQLSRVQKTTNINKIIIEEFNKLTKIPLIDKTNTKDVNTVKTPKSNDKSIKEVSKCKKAHLHEKTAIKEVIKCHLHEKTAIKEVNMIKDRTFINRIIVEEFKTLITRLEQESILNDIFENCQVKQQHTDCFSKNLKTSKEIPIHESRVTSDYIWLRIYEILSSSDSLSCKKIQLFELSQYQIDYTGEDPNDTETSKKKKKKNGKRRYFNYDNNFKNFASLQSKQLCEYQKKKPKKIHRIPLNYL